MWVYAEYRDIPFFRTRSERVRIGSHWSDDNLSLSHFFGVCIKFLHCSFFIAGGFCTVKTAGYEKIKWLNYRLHTTYAQNIWYGKRYSQYLLLKDLNLVRGCCVGGDLSGHSLVRTLYQSLGGGLELWPGYHQEYFLIPKNHYRLWIIDYNW